MKRSQVPRSRHSPSHEPVLDKRHGIERENDLVESQPRGTDEDSVKPISAALRGDREESLLLFRAC